MPEPIDLESTFPPPPKVELTKAALEHLQEYYEYAVENDMVLNIHFFTKCTLMDPNGKVVKVKENGLGLGLYDRSQVPVSRIQRISGIEIVLSLPHRPDEVVVIDLVDDDLAITKVA